MDLISNIRILRLPSWVKLVILLVIVPAFFGSISIILISLIDDDRADWVQAGASALGVFAPIALIVLVVWTTDSGISALQHRTEEVLCRIIPEHMRKICEVGSDFYDPRFTESGLFEHTSKKENLVDVRTNFVHGNCYCDYEITFPVQEPNVKNRVAFSRVELNVRKANFNIYFPTSRLTELCTEDHNQYVLDRFKHAIGGATNGNPLPSTENKDNKSATAYRFNSTLFPRELDGVSYSVLVASIELSSDFLWNPSEKLFFAQDLMFLLRALIYEGTDIYEIAN